MFAMAILAALALGGPLVQANLAKTETRATGKPDCGSGLRTFDPFVHKTNYTVGVHAPAGIDVAWKAFNLTFAQYLTATAGQRFQPPIRFDIKVTNTPIRDWVDLEKETNVDFIYADSGVYSCVGVESGAQSILTTVSRMEARGHYYDLDLFGGVIFARADNDDINDLNDIKGKIIGALEIGDFAGAQVQFYTMLQNGMDFIMDPKQVIFTGNQIDVVLGVLKGNWDVGFVRTGQIERTRDENGDLLDPDLFKILDPRIYVLEDGTLFPFLHSTPIFPEWPFAAMPNVPIDVLEEVQRALLDLEFYNLVYQKVLNCQEEQAQLSNTSNNEGCNSQDPFFFAPDAPCETTMELAELAYNAANAGGITGTGFRPARSYSEIRTFQEAAGFLNKDEKGKLKCIRAQTLYDGVTCPAQHYKFNRQKFEKSCDIVGLNCPDLEGYDCYCTPCTKAFEVDVYQINGSTSDQHTQTQKPISCGKMTLCGEVKQTKTITFRAVDNKERHGAKVTAIIHIDQQSQVLEVQKVANESFTYEFGFTEPRVSMGVLEVFFDGVQIPESPFRVQVLERNCNEDFNGQDKTAMEDGTCVCGSGTIEIAGECLSSSTFAIIISTVLFLLAMELGYLYLRYKRRKNDELWQVAVEELHFTEPIEVIGQGSFGVVLLAEFRGTKVAIKRALPPNTKARASRKNSKELINGSTDRASKGASRELDERQDIEAQLGTKSMESLKGGASKNSQLSFLLAEEFTISRGRWAGWCPSWYGMTHEHARLKSSILAEANSASASRRTLKATLCPCCDQHVRQREEFLEEMRLLSRLRHPCITTVMGAVMSSGHDPMLVMEYMEYGSLHDIIHSESMFFSGEINLQIMRDMAQGLRYLHSSKPPILHGDLKAKNILIDSRFRAKVCDFGLSTKKKQGISGTPFWLAPEYLRGRTEYNTSCDMYSVGIILYELYSRKDPYEGENYREVLRGVCNPRKNHRPKVPESCPPKVATLMKNLWSPDPFFRPQAKDLDTTLTEFTMRDAESLAEKEHKPKTKDMLYSLFPKHIADALSAGQKVEPEHHELVTVVFAEIIGFQEFARTLPPMKVTELVDRVFLAMDKVAEQHNIFKVETVGQCYMGVTNLNDKQQKTHVKDVALFAIESIQATEDIWVDNVNENLGRVHLRIGFHSGPVVTNVIGNLNPRYGLFGDTVNTASRMETHSVANRIQCTEKSAFLLQEQAPDVLVIKRGMVAVKGKGDMLTYWIGDTVRKSKDMDQSMSSDDGKQVSFVDTAGVCAYDSKKVVLKKGKAMGCREKVDEATSPDQQFTV